MKIISWNVNGFRSILKKGIQDYLEQTDPDILCLQETKIGEDQDFPADLEQLGYQVVRSGAKRKGYSGVATFVKEGVTFDPSKTKYGIAAPEYDSEGRFVITEHKDFLLYNTYIPSGTSGEARQQFKYAFLDRFLTHLKRLSLDKRKRLIVCGDFNICHREIDIHHPDVATKRALSGFLPDERHWMDTFTKAGFVDTFREVNGDVEGVYSWWSFRAGSRGKNLGWRIDYLFTAENLRKRIADAGLETEVMGSDHCPCTLRLNL